MRVAEIMVRDVPTCRPTDTLSAAAQVLWMRRSGTLPVVLDDGHGHELVGTLSDRDVFTAAHAHCRPLHAIRVVNAMARNPLTCRLDDPITVALERMQAHALDQIPVIDTSGRLAGVLLLADATVAAARASAPAKRAAA